MEQTSMKLKDLPYVAFAYLVAVPAFWLLIQYSHLCELIKEGYYIVFRIKYVKLKDKFHPVVRRV